MSAPADSTIGSALFTAACFIFAYALWLIGHYAGRFHRAGLARLRAYRDRQPMPQCSHVHVIRGNQP